MPFWQGIIGLGLVGALFLAIIGLAPFWGGGPTWQLALLLPARLRRHHPRLHRRPLRAGPARLAPRLPHRPGLHPLHLVPLAGPAPLHRAASSAPAAAGRRPNASRSPTARRRRVPEAAQSRVARQTQSITSGCSGSRAQSTQRGILCRSTPADLLGVDRHVDVGGEDGEQQREQPPAAEAAAGGVEDGEAAGDLGDAADRDDLLLRDRAAARSLRRARAGRSGGSRRR